MTCVARRGLCFVASAPAGAGKSAITRARRLCADDNTIIAL